MGGNSMKNNSIQGLRAYAAALVVASHTDFLNQGGLAVDFFFCLSGFLAVKPFSENDIRFHSWKDIRNYYFKKATAILPSYWIFLLILKLLTEEYWFTWESLVRTMLFIECPGHLWFIQQTAVMYLITPVLLLLLQAIKKLVKSNYSNLIQAIVLVFLSVLCYFYLTSDRFYLLGNGIHMKFFIWAYLIGMAFGLGYKFLLFKNFQLNSVFSSILGILFLVFPVFTSNLFLKFINPAYSEYYIGWALPWLCVILSGLFILILTLNENGLAARILKWKPFIALGSVSYETYILHWYFLSAMSMSVHHHRNFLLVYIVTICVSFGLRKLVDQLFQIKIRL